jgi:hypothetical protein
MNRYANVLIPLVIGLGLMFKYAEGSYAQEHPISAIDIALEPDEAMIRHAEAANARLLKVFPKGFALDASHSPHITLLQRYVRTSDLAKIYVAVGNVLAVETPATWTLKAFKYDYVVSDGIGGCVTMIERTDDLIRLQQKLIDATAPFTVETGTAAAFVTTPEDPDINQWTIDYVAHYVPASSGDKLEAHVTVGLAPPEYLKKMVAEPFDAFTFSPAAMSVYQLGNFGTARKQLQAWKLKS